MNIKLTDFVLFSFLFFTTAFVAPVLQAQNVQFLYSIQGGPSWTWLEPASPTVAFANPEGFGIAAVAGDPAGVNGFLTFFLSAYGGDFAAADSSGALTAYFRPISTNNQLFTGPPNNPTFITGTFNGLDLIYMKNASLVISDVVVPEPATYATLAGGLALVALAAAKRKKQSVISS